MSRSTIATKLISYLEERINCENVMKFADKTKKSSDTDIDKLLIENISVSFEIVKYNDDTKNNNNEINIKSKTDIQNLFDVFDFMTEANYTGFEYFPYLYGILNCHDGSNSKIYMYYESFDGNIIDLIDNIQHISEWYDIVFQMIMMNYYIQIINGYVYDGYLKNHLFKKLSKPYNKLYQFKNFKININHKYIIVLWNINFIEKVSDKTKNKIVSNINNLLQFLNENKNNIKNFPSNKIIKLLHEIKNNPNVEDVLQQYYGPVDTDK